jgi:hypothetical protein
MKLTVRANKFDLFLRVFEELKKIHSGNNVIPFPTASQRIGCIFHIKKEDRFALFQALQQRGFIQIVPFKGIRLKK